jgi:exonuclease III
MILIQWNCRGLRANLDEIQLLINKFNPVGIALQETMLSDNNIINIRKYTHFYCNSIGRDGRASGGASLFVLKSVPQSSISITTNLQAVTA